MKQTPTKKLKILVATGLYYPEIGGPATYVKMLEQHLPNYGVEINPIPFSRVKQFPKIIKHFKYAQLLWRESKDTDIIFALDPVSVGLPAMVVAKLRRKKFVLRVPGDFAWEQGQLRFGVTDTFHSFIEQRYSYGWRVSILCFIESLVAKQADQIIVPSDYMKAAVPKWGVDAKKVQRIYSALKTIEPTSGPLPKSFTDHQPLFVSSGRLVPNKGFITLIKAFGDLVPSHQRAALVIIGDGPQQAELEQLIIDLKLTNQVILTGRLNREVLASYIKAADAYVLNTAHEGLSHQLLEVMDIGTPIITTPVGGNSELITDGQTGLLFSYDNQSDMLAAMKKVITEPTLASSLATAATKKVEQFTAAKSVQETYTALQRVMMKL